jgi:hypothetical protein
MKTQITLEIIDNLLKAGNVYDLIQLRTGKNNMGNDVEKARQLFKIFHKYAENKYCMEDYFFKINVIKKSADPFIDIFKGNNETVEIVDSFEDFPNFIRYWKSKGVQVLYCRHIIFIPIYSELGILFKMYNKSLNSIIHMIEEKE